MRAEDCAFANVFVIVMVVQNVCVLRRDLCLSTNTSMLVLGYLLTCVPQLRPLHSVLTKSALLFSGPSICLMIPSLQEASRQADSIFDATLQCKMVLPTCPSPSDIELQTPLQTLIIDTYCPLEGGLCSPAVFPTGITLGSLTPIDRGVKKKPRDACRLSPKAAVWRIGEL